jgi:hypothetical protein
MSDLKWDKGHGPLQQDNHRGWVVEVEPITGMGRAQQAGPKCWYWHARYMRQTGGDVHTGMAYGTRQTEREAKAAAVAAVDATEDAGLLREIGSSKQLPKGDFDSL